MTKSDAHGKSSGHTQSGSATSGTKSTPKDIQVVTSILKDMNITEFDPKVVHQMIEFTYRYVANVLEEAQTYSNHAKKKTIDADDVKIAVQMQVDRSFTSPPERELLMEIARSKNNLPLPAIKSHNGPRLPPDRYSLVASNLRQKSSKSKPVSHIQLPFGRTSGTSLLTASTGSNILKASSNRPSLLVPRSSTPSNDNAGSVKRKFDDN